MTTMTPYSSDEAEEKVTTVIADDLHIKGTITFRTSLMIKGSLEGDIISEGLLVVGPTAKIDASIVTKSLISHGRIRGDVTASDQVVLKETAIQKGNITTPYIVVENGSTFNGSCVMKREKTAPADEANLAETVAEAEATSEESRYDAYREPTAEEPVAAGGESAIGGESDQGTEETAAQEAAVTAEDSSGSEEIAAGEESEQAAGAEEQELQKENKEDTGTESPLRSKWRRRELF